MASPGGPLVPFSPAECPPGVCNAYCPQGCYAFFPPPPPLGFGPDDSSGRNLSPLVIALISILASAFLLVSYYLLISRYCGGSFDSLRRRLAHDDGGGGADESGGVRGDAWQTPPPSAAGGLEEWVIRSIAVCRYKRGDGLVEGTDCSVCLSEFRDGESLRLLPDCCHAFHVSCIDTWLKSHSNCPVCRANIVYTFTTPSPSPPPRPPLPPPRPPPPPHVAAAPPPRRGPAVPEIRHDSAAVQEIGRGGEREDRCGVERGGVPVRKENPLRRHGVIELTEEGIQSNRPSSEGDFLPPPPPPPPPNDGTVQEVGSSRGFRAEQHAYKVSSGNRMLHCVIVNPSPAKGFLASGGMSCFAGQGKENRGSLLPL